MKLYHKDIGLPQGLRLPKGTFELTYSRHALRELRNDRYGDIEKIDFLCTRMFDVIEVGILGQRIEKIVYRGQYDDELDICIVVIPRAWLVKTVWLNERNDNHGTLDESKYEKG